MILKDHSFINFNLQQETKQAYEHLESFGVVPATSKSLNKKSYSKSEVYKKVESKVKIYQINRNFEDYDNSPHINYGFDDSKDNGSLLNLSTRNHEVKFLQKSH